LRILWVVYGSLDQQSGGYLYDRRVVGYLRTHGVEVELLGLPALPYLLGPLHGLHPRLRAALALHQQARGWDAVVIDELCHPSVFMLAAARARARRRRPPADLRPPLFTLVHHLRCREDRPPLARALARAWERRLLAYSAAVIVNSQTTARTVRELLGRASDEGAPPIAVCPPGCDQLALSSAAPTAPAAAAAAPADPRPTTGGPVRLLATGNLIPRKGYDLLLEMLAGLRDLPWVLRVAGRAVDTSYRRRLDRLARRLGLAERVAFLGELDGARLAEEYRAADVFVFASRYEGYGISLAEAVRVGLPFVAFAAGAVAEVVGGRGLLVPPGDRAAFAGHLRRLIADPAFRRQAAALSRELAAGLPTWEDTGRGVLQALREAVGEGAGRG
jgi:glycosyltransferase involved in cell wall biosynthesis